MRIFIILVLLTLAGCSSSPKKPDYTIDSQTQARVEAWKTLIESGRNWPNSKRLEQANAFVNLLNFIDDIDHWKQEDYWATPLQTVVTKGGDCEDFAIAKYFTLTSMGMSEEQLRLTYVKALSVNQAHMVVSYYAKPNDIPLVLDNLDPFIKPASQRPDLVPVYSFNGTGLWLAKREGDGQLVNSSDRISLWQSLLRSIDVEAADEQKMICLYQYYDLPQSTARQRCQ